MKTYFVNFYTKLTICNLTIKAPNVRFAKYLIDRQMKLNPGYFHVDLFTKNGVHYKTRKTGWSFYNDKKDTKNEL